jgi:hypothetical protein
VSPWTSTDGIAWEEHHVRERSFDVGDGSGREFTAAMSQLVRLGDTLYAFGGFQFMDGITTVGWRWTDGSQWELIESQSHFFTGGVTQVTASDDALFAINAGFTGGPRLRPSTWLWTPATSWVQTPLTSSENAEITVHASAWGSGTLIAVGTWASQVEGEHPWDWPKRLAVWTSPDGRDWAALTPPDDMSTACAVTALPDGSFAVIGTAGDAPAAWVLVNGADWIEGTIQPPVGPDILAADTTVAPCGAVSLGDMILAIGASDGATLTWTSQDGRDWAFVERLELSTTGSLPGLSAALGNQVLLVGSVPDPDADGRHRQVLLHATVRER